MCIDIEIVAEDGGFEALSGTPDPLSFLKHYTYVRRVKNELDEALRPTGLRYQSWVLLRKLNENTANQKALGKEICADKVAVSRAVKFLLEKGLIDRTYSDSDRRQSLLSIRASGREVIQQGAALLSKRFSTEWARSATACGGHTSNFGNPA